MAKSTLRSPSGPPALSVLFLALLIAAVAGPAPVGAEEGGESAADEPTLEIMGATKHPIPVLKASQSISIITRQDIKDINPRDLSEVIRLMSGVDVARRGVDSFDVGVYGLNKEYSNQLLVLIDGKPVMNSIYGHTWWREVPVIMDSIERIEVVKGPGSAQWGANAFAGVINIVTDHSSPRTRQGVRTSTRIGERGLFDQTLRLSDWKKDQGFTATFNYLTADGRPGLYLDDGTRAPGFEMFDRNYCDKWSAVVDYEKQFGTHTKLSTRYSVVRNSLDDPSAFSELISRNTSKWDVHADYFYAEVLHRLSDKRAVSFKAQRNNASNTIGYPPFVQVTGDWRLTQEDGYWDFDLQGRSDLGPAKYIYGLTYRRITSDGFMIEPPKKVVETKSAYGQLEYDLDKKTQGFLGLIFYDSSMTGFAYSPKLSLVREVGKDEVVRFGVGKAFRAPDNAAFFCNPWRQLPMSFVTPALLAPTGVPYALTQFYQIAYGLPFVPAPVMNNAISRVQAVNGSAGTWSPAPFISGNPNLENEEIQQIDIGFEHREAKRLFKFDAWYSETSKLITVATGARGIPIRLQTGLDFTGVDPTPFTGPFLNSLFQSIDLGSFYSTAGSFINLPSTLYSGGFTLEGGYTFSKKLRVDANFTYQDVHMQGYYLDQGDRTTAHTDAQFAPETKFNVIARFKPTDRDTVTGVVHHQSQRSTSGVMANEDLTKLPAFTSFDLAYRHDFGKHRESSLNVAVQNLFNDIHQELDRELDVINSPNGVYAGQQFDRTWLVRYDHQF